MPYTQNPYMPRLRRDVARYARRHGVRSASRHFGIHPGTISKWCKKAEKIGDVPILTQSSKPKTHPNELSKKIVDRIVFIRKQHGRTSEVVHQQLLNEGVKVSLNSVRRTIDRAGLMKKKSPWKRYHPSVPRPVPLKAGDLLQTDTVHRMINLKKRLYVFTLIDVYSRWVYAKAYDHMNGRTSIEFMTEAQRAASFNFDMIQSDHGPEFSRWFVTQIKKKHRYTRIGKPNDNAHIERFNRTIQEECLDKIPNEVPAINCALKKYLQYYNHERLHMGIQFKTPVVLGTYIWRID
jgi:transposase InsO family protein